MNKKLKIFLAVTGLFVGAVATLVLFSPYSYDKTFGYPLLKHSVVVKAPPAAVYEYLGNSGNAATWSEFVDHIIPLNPGEAADGCVGSFRRCFRQPDESGLQWDEEIVVDEKHRRRRLTIFNMKDFPIDAEWVATEQIYEKVEHGTRLTFTLFFWKSPSFADKLKMYLAAYRVKNIYRSNMNNIRNILEAGSSGH